VVLKFSYCFTFSFFLLCIFFFLSLFLTLTTFAQTLLLVAFFFLFFFCFVFAVVHGVCVTVGRTGRRKMEKSSVSVGAVTKSSLLFFSFFFVKGYYEKRATEQSFLLGNLFAFEVVVIPQHPFGRSKSYSTSVSVLFCRFYLLSLSLSPDVCVCVCICE
jgi:hypothetical protein